MLEGGCDCGKVRYRFTADPIMVNCCHCRLCQRQTGSGFAINVLIEAGEVELLGDAPVANHVETPSGMGQKILRCRDCGVSVWGIYGGAGDGALFVRAGTLDDPAAVSPRAHIYTESKLPWVEIPEGVPRFERFYSGKDMPGTFGEANAARWRKAIGR